MFLSKHRFPFKNTLPLPHYYSVQVKMLDQTVLSDGKEMMITVRVKG